MDKKTIIEVKRLNLSSLAKILTLLYIVYFALVLGVVAFFKSLSSPDPAGVFLEAMSTGIGGFIGFLVGSLLLAGLYNFLASKVGGLKIEVESEGRAV